LLAFAYLPAPVRLDERATGTLLTLRLLLHHAIFVPAGFAYIRLPVDAGFSSRSSAKLVVPITPNSTFLRINRLRQKAVG
jgi:hypothetical protein